MTATHAMRGLHEKPQNILTDFSLEVTARDADKLDAVGTGFPPDTIVSIPHLPAEEHSARVLAARMIRQSGHVPMPHVALRRFGSILELEKLLASLTNNEARVDTLLVLAGDIASENGSFRDTAAMLRSGLLAKHGIRHVAVAGHPEGHPQVSRQMLTAALREKNGILEDLGIEWSIITQFAFSAEPVLQWIDAVRQDGIEVPIRIGLPGPANVRTLLRFAAICGVSASTSVLKKYGLSVKQLFSNAGPDKLIEDYARLLSKDVHGETRMHFYPFGGIEKTAEWIRRNSAPL